MREGERNCVKYLKRGWNRKEGRGNKKFKIFSHAEISAEQIFAEFIFMILAQHRKIKFCEKY